MLESPYKEVAQSFEEINQANQFTLDLPFLRYDTKNIEDEFDYPDRSWWSWAYRFSTQFGWSLEYIAEIDVIEAFCMYQEHLISDFQDKEWEWMLSERYVGYDTATKKSKIIPMPKPNWMLGKKPKEIKPVKIRKDMLPSGVVVSFRNAKPVPSP
jgi:hypothetical protein